MSKPGTAIRISGLSKRFGSNRVLDGFDLTVGQGEFVTILGASGSGKTTLLRSISGLEVPDEGTIEIDGRVAFDAARGVNVAPSQRDVGLIFQSYALWPHKRVDEHLSYVVSLAARRKTLHADVIRDTLALVDLTGLEKRFPHQLSGGQQQRVAVARALVTRPALLLMDEPLSNLDYQLRLRLRGELRNAHDRSGATSIYITHDQTEAFALSDRIVLLEGGRLIQQGLPEEFVLAPATPEVARFVGFENIVETSELAARGNPLLSAVEKKAGKPATIAFRASALTPDRHGGDVVPVGAWTVRECGFDGAEFRLLVELAGTVLRFVLPYRTASHPLPRPRPAPGETVELYLDPASLVAW